VRGDVVLELGDADRFDVSLGTENRARQRRALKRRRVQVIKQHLRRGDRAKKSLVRGAQLRGCSTLGNRTTNLCWLSFDVLFLLQYDASLGLDVFGRELRVLHDVAQNVDRLRHVFA
jgi:hypothetical protein